MFRDWPVAAAFATPPDSVSLEVAVVACPPWLVL